jgi:hypothetical protein
MKTPAKPLVATVAALELVALGADALQSVDPDRKPGPEDILTVAVSTSAAFNALFAPDCWPLETVRHSPTTWHAS